MVIDGNGKRAFGSFLTDHELIEGPLDLQR
jgi:hypothetical protein